VSRLRRPAHRVEGRVKAIGPVPEAAREALDAEGRPFVLGDLREAFAQGVLHARTSRREAVSLVDLTEARLDAEARYPAFRAVPRVLPDPFDPGVRYAVLDGVLVESVCGAAWASAAEREARVLAADKLFDRSDRESAALAGIWRDLRRLPFVLERV